MKAKRRCCRADILIIIQHGRLIWWFIRMGQPPIIMQQLATMRGLQSMPQSMDLFCGIRTEKPIKPASVQERIHSGMLAFRMPFICMKMGFV